MKNKTISTLAGISVAAFGVLLVWFIAGRAGDRAGSAPIAAREISPPARSARSDPARQMRDRTRQILVDDALAAALRAQLLRDGVRQNEAVVSFKDADAYQRFLARAAVAGLTVPGRIDALNSVRVGFASIDALERDLAAHAADYEDLGANAIVQFPQTPSAEDRAARTEVPLGNGLLKFLGIASDPSLWGRGVTIAVLDSGVFSDATFGSGRLRALDIGLGVTGNGAEDGHGTAVAALAAGASSDAQGVAPGASLLSIRVTGADGTSDMFTLAQAIISAVDAGAQVVNISLGGYQNSSTLSRAIEYASARNVALVASAGNDQAAQLTWPAADARVVSVGAVDALGQQVIFSNSGTQLSLTAPGYGVQTAWSDGARVLMDGTSASAPIVAGSIAALMSQNSGMTAPQAAALLEQYASDGGAAGADPDYGNGVLNLGWAMARDDYARVDTAVSSHYYDAADNTLDFVLQNRSARSVAGLTLAIDASGAASSVSIPLLQPGGTQVVTLPVDTAALAKNGTMVFRTQLLNPAGTVDAVPANNVKSSSLTAPAAP